MEAQIPINSLNTPVSLYRSKKNGVTLYHVEKDGPISFSTELLDDGYFNCDDGLPHTLEHLIFRGSKNYPYNNLLDSLANLCIADGTNGFTTVDHTCYTITTGGNEGFLQFLPIYIDHALNPLLTEETFATEVHHINGEGSDAGVVYNEMLSCENTESELMDQKLREIIFTNTGFKGNYGGKLHNLRNLTVEKVIKYHHQFYRPDNMCVIVIGKVDYNKLKILIDNIQSINNKNENNENEIIKRRPWVGGDNNNKNEIEIFKEEKVEKFQFPSEEEDNGEVCISIRGKGHNDIMSYLEYKILLDYLIESSISPLKQSFTECDDPLCNEIYSSSYKYTNYIYCITFEGVSTGKLDEIVPLYKKVINEIINNNNNSISSISGEGLDMNRITYLIKRMKLQYLKEIEENGAEVISKMLIRHFIYSNRDTIEKEIEILNQSINRDSLFDILLKKDKMKWEELFKEYFIDNNTITLIGIPSSELANQNSENEKNRLNKQKLDLGEKKLKELDEKIKLYLQHNNPVIPNELKDLIKPSNINNIYTFNIYSYIPNQTQAKAKTQAQTQNKVFEKLHKQLHSSSSSSLGMYIEFHHIESSFIHLELLMDSKDLTKQERLYLPIIIDILFKLPQYRIIDGEPTYIKSKEVINELTSKSVEYSSGIGLDSTSPFELSAYASMISIELVFDINQYEEAVNWLYWLTTTSNFTIKQIKIMVNYLLSSISDCLRDSGYLMGMLFRHSVYEDSSNEYCINVIEEKKFLKDLLKRINNESESEVEICNEFDVIRKKLINPKRMRLYIIGDMNKISDIYTPLTIFELSHETDSIKNKTTSLERLRFPYEYMNDKWFKPNNELYLLGSKEVESTDFVQKMIFDIKDSNHNDLAALSVCCELLSNCNGILWKELRGNGLVYGCSVYYSLSNCTLSISFDQCSDIVKTYDLALQCIKHLITEKDIDKYDFESFKCSSIYFLLEKIETQLQTAETKFVNILKGYSPQYELEMIKKIEKVKIDDIYSVLEKYIIPLISSSNVQCWCVCPDNLLDKTIQNFKQMGKNVIVYRNPREIYEINKKSKKDKRSNTLLFASILTIVAICGIFLYKRRNH